MRLLRISMFTFFTFSSFAVIAFYLPLLYQHKGLTNGEIGLVMGLGSFVAIFAQPFWGLVSDRRKTVKKVLATVLLAGTVISIPLFLSSTLGMLMLFMVLFMFFFSSAGPLTESLIVNFAHENRRNYGSIRLWGEVGVGTAALWIGFTIESAGIGLLGWLFAGIVAVGLFSMYWLPDAKAHSTPVTKESIHRLFSNRAFLLFLGFILFISIPHRMNDTFLPIYLKELGASESDVGIAWLIATLSAVPTMALIGAFLKKYSELIFISMAGMFYTVRWLIYSFADDPIVVMFAQGLHMLTFPIVLVASVQFVFKIVPRELIATGQTLFTAVYFGIGGIVGSSLGGWIMDAYGSQQLYAFGSILAMTGCIMILLFMPYFIRERNKHIQLEKEAASKEAAAGAK
jgi:PPP family 3-phenylpropionic acid transporter